MDLYLGVVSTITDTNKFVITATIPGFVEDIVAYPIDTFDEPNEGDPIILYGIESIFGYSFMYKKQRLKDHTRLKLGKQVIDITDHNITISSALDEDDAYDADDGIKLATGDKKTIEIDADGEIVVHSGKDATVKIDKNLEIKVSGSASIEVTGSCDVKARSVSIKADTMTELNSGSNMVAPDPTGGAFCAIPICPYTGQPHCGKIVM